MTETVWNSADKGALIVLSNNDKTATFPSGSNGFGVRGTTYKGPDSGKFYLEFASDIFLEYNGAIGFLNSTAEGGNLGDGVSGIPPMIDYSGYYYGQSNGIGSPNGKNVGWAIDTLSGKAWYRYNGGLWNNSATADPATGVGGYGYAKAKTITPYMRARNPVTRSTLLTKTADFAYAAPTGFDPWDMVVADTGDATATLSGTAAVGSVLTCTFNNDDPDGAASGVAYQWVRGTSTAISGATASTYTVAMADVGASLHCVVTYTDAKAYSETISTGASATVPQPTKRVTAGFSVGVASGAVLRRSRRVPVAFDVGPAMSAHLRAGSLLRASMAAGADMSATLRKARRVAVSFEVGATMAGNLTRPSVHAAFGVGVAQSATLRTMIVRDFPVVQSNVIVFGL